MKSIESPALEATYAAIPRPPVDLNHSTNPGKISEHYFADIILSGNVIGVVTGVSLGFILVAICTFVCIYSKCKRKPDKQQSNPNPVQANMEYLQTQNNSQNVELNPVGPYVSSISSGVSPTYNI